MKLEKIDKYRYRIPAQFRPKGSRECIVYSSPQLVEQVYSDNALQQIINVSTLPGLVGDSMAMPDVHMGYGFPIGGVAAFDISEGIISPGGVGYDINCGINLTVSKISRDEIIPLKEKLIQNLFQNIPCGVGKGGSISLNKKELKTLASDGARWAVQNNYASSSETNMVEEKGQMQNADPDFLSDRTFERGKSQVGTLGSGNHFIEVQYVEEIFDESAAKAYELWKNQICFMIHSGSRGFGYQICQESLPLMAKASQRHKFNLNDIQLACAPLNSAEGKKYFSSMCCAANYAWVNRLVLVELAKRCFEDVFKTDRTKLGLRLLYDVSHNIAKIEKHEYQGKTRELCVHRKGATRAFAPGRKEIPDNYRKTGQPVLIPGDMGRCSYVLCGTQRAMEETFGSACHGAGRQLSRRAALKQTQGLNLIKELAEKDILVQTRSKRTLGEEASIAYKDVNHVVSAACGAGIVAKVARLRPLLVIKG